MTKVSKKLIFFVLLFCCLSMFAGERYSVRMLPDGNMYFFMPLKLTGDKEGKLQYDMTLLSYRDSVSMNITLNSPVGRVKSVRLSSADTDYTTTQYELYFQERKGSRVNTRLHIDCPFQTYKKLFSGQQPLSIELTMEDGKRYAFTYKPKMWKKETGFVSEVLEMIDYSNSR